MGETMRVVGAILLGTVLMLGIVFAVQGADFFVYRWFAPAYEDVRRETFEHSKAYNQGMVQELQSMVFELHRTTDPDSRAAMSSIILRRAADYDVDRLPPELRAEVLALRDERNGR